MKIITGKDASQLAHAASTGIGIVAPVKSGGAARESSSSLVLPAFTEAGNVLDSPITLDTPRISEDGAPTPSGLGFNFSRGQSPEIGSLGMENLQLYNRHQLDGGVNMFLGRRGSTGWEKEDLQQLDTCCLGPMQ
jgi:hypothetical protein